MGSLAVLMKMGVFSMRGGAEEKPIYEIGSPIFDEISIHLNHKYYPGKRLPFKPRTIRPRICISNPRPLTESP